eukprot:Selendium_serpulae@DN5249_c0_g1_i1.p2
MLVGTLMAFDRHMNIVLADCEEYRRIKQKGTEEKEMKRSLGFILIRGENIISMVAEAPPPAEPRQHGEQPLIGPGRGVAAGRGVTAAALTGAPAGLAGPVMGIGGPAPAKMLPGGRGVFPGAAGMPGGGPLLQQGGGMRPGMPPMMGGAPLLGSAPAAPGPGGAPQQPAAPES